ncbi:hypothetical protein DBV15_10504 [Temnothorax longispinosus]|uniref:Uncharacterized protein n=1 Tax=Temnothorax longispinosus TaxID=300112 RepID=A0A4S2KH18_9HYME|nr:hypothetical protein DBV15_10504 [Temnothorax longispinosus]
MRRHDSARVVAPRVGCKSPRDRSPQSATVRSDTTKNHGAAFRPDIFQLHPLRCPPRESFSVITALVTSGGRLHAVSRPLNKCILLISFLCAHTEEKKKKKKNLDTQYQADGYARWMNPRHSIRRH